MTTGYSVAWQREWEPPERMPDPDGYIDLDPTGIQHAMAQGALVAHMSPRGALCLRCGAIVGGIALHDAFHQREGKP